MSITVHQSPTNYPSAHGELWHVVESTNKAVIGFQYVFDIYKGANLVTRVKNTPYGSNKLGVLDVGNIVRAAMPTDSMPALILDSFSQDVTLGADVFWTEYDVRYGEVSGGVLSANITSGTYRAYNNYSRSKWDRAKSDISGVFGDSGVFQFSSSRLLTNRPDRTNYYPNEPVVLTMFIDDTAAEFYRGLYIGQEEGSETFVTDRQYTNSSNYNKAFAFTYFPSGNVNLIEISTNYGGSNQTYQIKKLFKKCSKYDTHTLVFLNAYGVYDSFTFVYGKLTMANEKNKFEQLRWKVSGNSMVESSSGIYNESVKNYAGSYKETMELTSDILSTGEYNWLSELINSPLVYYYSKDNEEFYPVIITNTNYEFKDDRINKAETITVNIEFSESINTQYR